LVRLVLVIFLFLLPPLVLAQEEEANVVGYRFLDYSTNIPDDLLESKSVVLVSSATGFQKQFGKG
jgi:hypothetical protein